MAKLKVTSDKAEVVVSLGVDKISYSATGEILDAAPVLETPIATTVSNGLVEASEDYNTYIVKPTSGTQTLAIDVTQVSGCDFDIVLDFTKTVAAVTMPENFEWVGGVTPTMTKKGVYTITTTQLVTGDSVKLLGRCSSAIKVPIYPNKGVVTSINGAYAEDYCGEYFSTLTVDFGEADDSMIDSCKVVVNDGGVIDGELSFSGDYVYFIPLQVEVRGGTIGKLIAETENSFTVDIYDGYVAQFSHVCFNGIPTTRIYGGTINAMYLGATGTNDVVVSGGFIGVVGSEFVADSFSISGGTIRSVGCSGKLAGGFIDTWYASFDWSGAYEGADVTITGGSVRLLDASEEYEGPTNIQISGGTVGEIRTPVTNTETCYIPITSGAVVGTFTANVTDSAILTLPKVSAGCTIQLFEVSSANVTTPASLTMSPEATVNFGPNAQSLIDSGILTIITDPNV